MRRTRIPLTIAALLVVCLCMAPGCKKKPLPVEPTTPTPVKEAPKPAPPPVQVEDKGFKETAPVVEQEPDLTASEIARQLRTVYFEFDRSDLSASARETLKYNADILKKHPRVPIVIEGHCDERGTIEYNLALGQRRADAIRAYLGSLGVDGSRLRVISYGEERPAQPGKTETAWAKNRRGEFVP